MKSNKFQFVRKSIFGCTIYEDTTGRFQIIQGSNEKYYLQMNNSVIPEYQGDGFNTVEEAQSFLNESQDFDSDASSDDEFKDDLAFFLMMYGFSKLDEENSFIKELPDMYRSYMIIHDLGDNKHLKVERSDMSGEEVFDNFFDMSKYLDDLLKSCQFEVLSCVAICNRSNTQEVVQAAINSRDLTRNMVRVKSSNMWSYGIHIKDNDTKVGDVVVQFKGPKGGPGDIYLYYDVPVNLWRKWLAAPSKGNFFWRFIRNDFQYRKLTGDKKGKLKNAVN